MKKMFIVLISLVMVYFLLEVIIITSFSSYTENYKIKDGDNIYNIKEISLKNSQKEDNNYYFEIKVNNSVFNFQTFTDLKNRKVIKNIKYYKDDEYECLLPIFKGGKILFDITCKKDDYLISYHNIVNKPKALEDFAHLVPEYDMNLFLDKSSNTINEGIYNIYVDNLIKKHYLAFTTYQGITTINKKITTNNFFHTDKYAREISSFADNYYITADYNKDYEFNTFYLFNIKTNKLKEIKDQYNISFDSYIQGYVKDNLYLLDIDNKIQYKIDLNHMYIDKIGTVKKGIKTFENGKWVDMDINDAINHKILFSEKDKEIMDDTIIYTSEKEKSGFIYTLKKHDNVYSLYKSSVQNKDIKTYLFDISDDKIMVIDDYIYFKDKDAVYYYNDLTGKRKIVQSDELLFNNNLIYTVTK